MLPLKTDTERSKCLAAVMIKGRERENEWWVREVLALVVRRGVSKPPSYDLSRLLIQCKPLHLQIQVSIY